MRTIPAPHGESAGSAPDAGITLVELIVTVSVSVLFLGLMASLFGAGMQGVQATRERDAATGAAQVITDSLQASVRNAAAVSVSGSVLRARVATGPSGWECRAWALTPDGSLTYRAQAVGPIDSDPATWGVLARGVSGNLAGGVPFTYAGQGGEVDIALTVTAGSVSVPVTAAVAPQALSETAPDPC